MKKKKDKASVEDPKQDRPPYPSRIRRNGLILMFGTISRLDVRVGYEVGCVPSSHR